MKISKTNEIVIAIISVVFACSSWLYIRNIVKPIVEGFVNVTVNVTNEKELEYVNKSYAIKDSKIVKITYNASAENIQRLRKNDFRAYVDLQDLIDSKTSELPIHIDVLNDMDKYIYNVKVTPETLKVELDDTITIDKNIEYGIEGSIGDGNSISNVILEPQAIYIKGSSDNIDKVKAVHIDIPVNEVDDIFSGKANVVVFDKDNKIINIKDSGLTLNPDMVNYSMQIKTTKDVPLNCIIDGNVQEGYEFKGAVISPAGITIKGSKNVIQTYDSINLPVIDLSSLTENTTFVFDTKDFIQMGIESMTEGPITVVVEIGETNIYRGSIESIGPHLQKEVTPKQESQIINNTTTKETSESTETSETEG